MTSMATTKAKPINPKQSAKTPSAPKAPWPAPPRTDSNRRVAAIRQILRTLADVGDLTARIEPSPEIVAGIHGALDASPDLRKHLFFSLDDEERDGFEECDADVFVAALLGNWLNANRPVLRALVLDRRRQARKGGLNPVPSADGWDLFLEEPGASGRKGQAVRSTDREVAR